MFLDLNWQKNSNILSLQEKDFYNKKMPLTINFCLN